MGATALHGKNAQRKAQSRWRVGHPAVYGCTSTAKLRVGGARKPMMAAIFATALLAFAASWRGHQRFASLCFLLGIALAVGLFLYEIYSPQYGFRMPWLQTLDGSMSTKPRLG